MARNLVFTFINVIGLALGLAMFFVLWQYTENELKSDQQWKDANLIYRFGILAKWTDDKTNWEESYVATNPVSLADQIIPRYSEIAEVTRILSQQNVTGRTKEQSYVGDHGTELYFSVQNGTEKKSFKETNIVYGDPNLFTFFGIPLIEGQPESVLRLAGSIALSETLAIKYFGTTHAIGKTILIDDHISLTVAAYLRIFRTTPTSFSML